MRHTQRRSLGPSESYGWITEVFPSFVPNSHHCHSSNRDLHQAAPPLHWLHPSRDQPTHSHEQLISANLQLPKHLLRSCPMMYYPEHHCIVNGCDTTAFVHPTRQTTTNLAPPRFSSRNSIRPMAINRTALGAAARRSARHCRTRLSGLPPLPSRPKSAHLSRPVELTTTFSRVKYSNPGWYRNISP